MGKRCVSLLQMCQTGIPTPGAVLLRSSPGVTWSFAAAETSGCGALQKSNPAEGTTARQVPKSRSIITTLLVPPATAGRTAKEAAPAPANKAAGNGRLHKTRTRPGRTGARFIRATVATRQDQAAPAPANTGNGRHKNKTRPHRRPLYTGNGRHKNKTRPHRRPRATVATRQEQEPRPQRLIARDLAPRARGTDASIPSGRAGTDECADAD